ncbi:MAG: hypothetical protein WD055_04305 [Candidatus Dependentiae bacterium]
MKNKNILAGLLFTLNIAAIQVPDWYQQMDNILNNLEQFGGEVTEQIAFMDEWNEKLKPWCSELRKRGNERKALFACIRTEAQNYDRTISNLETTIAKKNNNIIDTKKNIAALENEIATLNIKLARLENKIEELKAAYATLLDLNEDKADELIAQINTLKEAYDDMIKKRDVLRKTLESFYQCVKAHDYEENTDMFAFAKEIGCDMEGKEPR